MFALIIFFFSLINKANSFNKLNIFHWICILNANLILWVKNEGFIFLLAIFSLLLIERKTDKKIKLLFLFSFTLLILIKFSIFSIYFKENLIGWKGYEFLNLEKIISLENLKRLPLLFYKLGSEHWPALKTFIIYLNRYPENSESLSKIPIDPQCFKELRLI